MGWTIESYSLRQLGLKLFFSQWKTMTPVLFPWEVLTYLLFKFMMEMFLFVVDRHCICHL